MDAPYQAPCLVQHSREGTVMPSIDNDALVYSTEHGDLRKRRARPAASRLSLSQQTAFIYRASKGHGGKVVTLVKNPAVHDDHKALTRNTLNRHAAVGERSKTA